MSNLMPMTTTSTELQRNYRTVVRKSKETRKPIIVLSNNKPEGVYIDYQTFVRDYTEKEVSKKTKTQNGFDRAFGSWTKEEADRFDKIIEDAFEQINPEGWK